MDILFTDLDNTLIYSRKTDIKKRISVEVYKGEDNSFMSKYSYELLKKLHERLLIVPVTTRTYTQYERINLSILPKYVLCANGGQLLKNGVSDNEWYLKSLEIIAYSAVERQKAFTFEEIVSAIELSNMVLESYVDADNQNSVSESTERILFVVREKGK